MYMWVCTTSVIPKELINSFNNNNTILQGKNKNLYKTKWTTNILVTYNILKPTVNFKKCYLLITFFYFHLHHSILFIYFFFFTKFFIKFSLFFSHSLFLSFRFFFLFYKISKTKYSFPQRSLFTIC